MARNEYFNEATRVQMPALVHLTRIGYNYYGKITEDMKGIDYDPDTNILIKIFMEQFKKLNPDCQGTALDVLRSIRQELDNDDLGKSFYDRLLSVSPLKLIDFDNPRNNVFHCTAEFTCKNGEDEFRPDITLFVNGLPLVFIEVKKPNNSGGMLAESNRMNYQRFPNKKFRRFINLTQFMIFSNNMEYDAEGGIVPIQGAFYCTAARKAAPFNCFREENPFNHPVAPYNRDFSYKDIDNAVEYKILSDFNVQVIHTAPEYQTNLNTYSPTNRILTSMCSPERLLYIIKYGIAYVHIDREVDGKIETTDQKHIMRYQQLFASLAIRDKIAAGVKSGVIWHTQGSGKAAIVVPTGFVTSQSGIESKILKHIVDEHIVYGVISMPSNVFASTGTNVSVLFLDNSKKSENVILIDASKLGEDYKDGNITKHRLSEEEINKIVNTFLNKEVIDDFSVVVNYDDIKSKNCSLSAGQYFDVKIEYIDITAEQFENKMNNHTQNLKDMFAESHNLEEEIMEQLAKLKFEE